MREFAERTLRSLLLPWGKVPQAHGDWWAVGRVLKPTGPLGRPGLGGEGAGQAPALPLGIPAAGRGLTSRRGTPQVMGPVRAQLWRERHGLCLLVQVGLWGGLGRDVAWGGQPSPHLQVEARHPGLLLATTGPGPALPQTPSKLDDLRGWCCPHPTGTKGFPPTL